jgi:hypothetical protein
MLANAASRLLSGAVLQGREFLPTSCPDTAIPCRIDIGLSSVYGGYWSDSGRRHSSTSRWRMFMLQPFTHLGLHAEYSLVVFLR